MKTINTDNALFVDVDETLILWGPPEDPEDVELLIKDSYLTKHHFKAIPHNRNIELLKRNKAQGRTIIVWSAGGMKHARNIVKVLKLTKFVDVVMGKPIIYLDDLDMAEWNCSRIYLNKNLPKHNKHEVDKTDERS